MADKIKLNVLGISQNQIQSGAYALILVEEEGQHRIPVVIGPSEAQSIAARLERVNLPRPLVHDLFRSVVNGFGIRVKEVMISKFENGVFYSEMTLAADDREIVVDSRTSDAIAIAMRTHTPIFTTKEVVEKTGFLPEDTNPRRPVADEDEEIDLSKVPLHRFANEELKRMLDVCIRKEEYEKAAEIKAVLDEKTKEKQ